MFEKLKYHALLHVIIFLWGFTGILGVLIDLDSIPLVWHRVMIAVVALAIGMTLLRKSFQPPSLKMLVKVGLVGVAVALHWVTFYKSIDLSTASLGILCLSTTPLHVAWMEPLLMKRRISFIEISLGTIVIYSIYFVSGNFNAREYEALAYGLASAFFAAIFAVFNAQFSSILPPSKITFYEMIAAFLFLSLVLAVNGGFSSDLFDIRTQDWWLLVFLGVVCTSFAFLANVEILRHLGAFTVSLSINLEPVYTIIMAIVILNENEVLSGNFYIGAALIVLVVIANAFIKSQMRKKNSVTG